MKKRRTYEKRPPKRRGETVDETLAWLEDRRIEAEKKKMPPYLREQFQSQLDRLKAESYHYGQLNGSFDSIWVHDISDRSQCYHIKPEGVQDGRMFEIAGNGNRPSGEYINGLYEELEKGIKEEAVQGMTLTPPQEQEHEQYSQKFKTRSFTIFFTKEAKPQDLERILDKIMKRMALRIGYAPMDTQRDIEGTINESEDNKRWRNEHNPAQEKLRELRYESESLLELPIIKGKPFSSNESTVEAHTRMQEAIAGYNSALTAMERTIMRYTGEKYDTIQEHNFTNRLRKKRKDLGFKSMRDMANHSLAHEGGTEAREKMKWKCFTAPDDDSPPKR